MDNIVIRWTADDPDYEERELIAFILDTPANPGCVMSYMHIGQHGEASKAFMYDCKPATRAESEPLRQELIEIGYELEA